MFFRKKALYDSDPKTLDLETLSVLQKGLLAKLLIVTEEMRSRFEKLAELGANVTGAEDSTAALALEGKRMRGIALIVENVLAQQVGTAAKTQNSN